jgi:hypothetical protein
MGARGQSAIPRIVFVRHIIPDGLKRVVVVNSPVSLGGANSAFDIWKPNFLLAKIV